MAAHPSLARVNQLLAAGIALLAGFLMSASVEAVPSMARQTGMPCAVCHTVYPELTPFGRAFKLGGFSLSTPKGPDASIFDKVPVAALLQVSRTATKNTGTEEAMSEDFPRDRETIIQAAGVYYGGKIFDNLGALVQYNYDGIERRWGVEMVDVRYGSTTTVADKGLTWGVSMNNTPTLADIYNSTPMWAFPHTEDASLMPAANPVIDMTLASQVGGFSLYGLLDSTWYGELGAYRTANSGFFRFMGLGVPTETVVDGTSPHWRLAWQKDDAPHSFAIGTHGMVAKVFADTEEQSLGSDRFRDIAFDAQYQYITDEHQFSAHATWIHEKQEWKTSFDQGLSSSPSTTLKSFKADLHYYFRRQVGGGVEYFQIRGDTNDLRYNTGEAVMGSANGSPNSRGWLFELNWLPIQNLKLGARYTAYQQFNGASDNYDGFGRNAKDNNSVFVYAWLLI
ncbi:MAG TPA: hypothetical protein VF814_15415 [Casimicrobiaceae bacterium]